MLVFQCFWAPGVPLGCPGISAGSPFETCAVSQSAMKQTALQSRGNTLCLRWAYKDWVCMSFLMFFPPDFHQIQELTHPLVCLQGNSTKMSLTWREREHEAEDMVALHDPVTVNALRNCGLLKFFRISSIRAQISLLQYILDAWDPVNQVFQIRGKTIPLTIEDMYFLTGLYGPRD